MFLSLTTTKFYAIHVAWGIKRAVVFCLEGGDTIYIFHTFNYSYFIKINIHFFDNFLFTISYIKIQLLVIGMNVFLHKKWMKVEI